MSSKEDTKYKGQGLCLNYYQRLKIIVLLEQTKLQSMLIITQ